MILIASNIFGARDLTHHRQLTEKRWVWRIVPLNGVHDLHIYQMDQDIFAYVCCLCVCMHTHISKGNMVCAYTRTYGRHGMCMHTYIWRTWCVHTHILRGTWCVHTHTHLWGHVTSQSQKAMGNIRVWKSLHRTWLPSLKRISQAEYELQ